VVHVTTSSALEPQSESPPQSPKTEAKAGKDEEVTADFDWDLVKPMPGSDTLPCCRDTSYHTFLGTPTVKARKKAIRELLATVPSVPQFLEWSDTDITWSQADHPETIPEPGKYALVVNPLIDGYEFSKCLMDGGSSINILYLETLHKMNLSETQLKHSPVTFHGVVPGRQAKSLGSIVLTVAFGDEDNYREEYISFEVVPFKSAYHAILGRPAFRRFMARSCYIYNKLKMPGPKGVITVNGNFAKAQEAELGEAAFAEAVLSADELKAAEEAVDPKEMPATKKQVTEAEPAFEAVKETKKIELVPGNPDKFTTISSTLSEK
jgi:hypothetical protein